MGDVEGGEIGADHRHHRVDGALARHWQPFRLGLVLERRAELARQILADRFEIVARIEALGDRADVLAQGLAVAEVGRARQDVDLAAGVVDVIFARGLAAGKDQEAREGVAEHRAARMADVHRPGRVGAHIFDVDRPLRARRPGPEAHALGEDRAQNPLVDLRLEHDVDEARPGGFGAQNVRFAREIQRRGLRPRRADSSRPLWLRAHRPSPRWSRDRRAPPRAAARRRSGQDRDRAAVLRRDPFLEQHGDARLEVGENVHVCPCRRRLGASGARASIASRKRRQKGGHARRSRTGRSCRRCSRRPPARARPARPWRPSRRGIADGSVI